MFENRTPYEWREAAVSWVIATVWWSIVWYIPFVLLSGWTRGGDGFFLIIGSVGVPFISAYLLFRTIARMITRAGEDPDDDEVSERTPLTDEPEDGSPSD